MAFAIGAAAAMAIAAPGLLAFTPQGYDLMNSARFVVFLLVLSLFVWLGRRRRAQRRRAGRVGLLAGLLAGAAGSIGSRVIMQSPAAAGAFVSYLALRGVPRPAALTVLQLHAVASATLNAILSALFFGALGAFGSWWGAKSVRRSSPTPTADPST